MRHQNHSFSECHLRVVTFGRLNVLIERCAQESLRAKEADVAPTAAHTFSNIPALNELNARILAKCELLAFDVHSLPVVNSVDKLQATCSRPPVHRLNVVQLTALRGVLVVTLAEWTALRTVK